MNCKIGSAIIIYCSGLVKINIRMSILFVVLLVGGSTAFSFRNLGYENSNEPMPMQVGSSLCAELCQNGLIVSGNQCVENCLATQSENVFPVCQEICRLKVDILKCECEAHQSKKSSSINVEKICDVICENGIKLAVCDFCSDNEREKREAEEETTTEKEEEENVETTTAFDQEAFCKEECAQGNGGSACNCDILPLNAVLSV
ncbi:uncharacterized protein LOC108739440 [Agrilus planipennis]|uniref:Uncharacterized protein LOC108739440 n=1 Tax=Agrilus planipennis TaxID=224129 RepID=A0A1W4WYC0_AGRPL|nr:uncharacterized protein LOC108739440 [Agrilus planipennis]